MFTLRTVLLMLGCSLATIPVLNAQQYPTKPVRYIVGYAAGGGTDIIARLIARKLSESMGQQVIIDNRPGAGGNIATEIAVHAPADGYTILMGNVGPMTVNPHLYKLTFSLLRDLSPITQIAASHLLVVVHPSLQVSSLKDLIALAQREPGKLSYSSAGVGTSNHLAGALFSIEARVNIVHIPYKGAAPALTDLVAGRVQLSFQTLTSAGRIVQSGKLKALAVTSTKRSALFPDIPTATESGLDGFEVSAWYGMLVPVNTPRPVIDKINRATVEALKNKEIAERLSQQGAEPVGSTPEAFGKFMRSETEKWAKVVKISGMKAE